MEDKNLVALAALAGGGFLLYKHYKGDEPGPGPGPDPTTAEFDNVSATFN